MKQTLLLNLYCLLVGAWMRRYLIVVPMLIMPLLGVLIAKGLPQRYESHTTILLQETAKLNPLLEDLTVSLNIKDRQSALDTLLHSRHVLRLVGEDMKLFTKAMGDRKRDEIIARLSAHLSLSFVGADLIRLAYWENRPDRIKGVLRSVSWHFIDLMMAPERSSVFASERFLKAQIEAQHKALMKAEKNLADYKSAHAGELPELHAANVQQLQSMSQQLTEDRIDLAGAEQRLKSLRQRLIQTNPVLGNLDKEAIQARAELIRLRSRYTDQHSQVQRVLRRLQRLKEERSSMLAQFPDAEQLETLLNIASVADIADQNKDGHGSGLGLLETQLDQVQQAEADYHRLQEEVRYRDQAVSKLSDKVSSYGTKEQRIRDLSRDLKVKSELYNEMLHRFEMARITGALGRFEESSQIKVIDEPETPSYPVNLPWVVFMIAGIVAGLLLGISMAVVAELTQSSLWRRDHISRLINVPVLVRLPEQQPPPVNPGGLT